MRQTPSVDPRETDLRQRLAEVDERIDRIGKRFTAGYGSDADRDGWLAWLRELQARRTALRTELAELVGRDGDGTADAEAMSG